MSTFDGKFTQYRLDNGLLVALHETPSPIVAGRLRIFHGALNERSGEEGIAHFLEHTLVTGGTVKYSPEQVNKFRCRLGSFNANTWLHRTELPVEMFVSDVSLYLALVSDIAFNPRFEPLLVEQERQRVLREIGDCKSKPTFRDFTQFNDAMFGKGYPHNYFILGKEEVIGSSSVQALSDFHQRGYFPNSMDLLLAGGLPKNVRDLIQESFGAYTPGEFSKWVFPRNPKIQGSTMIHSFAPDLINRDNTNQSNALMVLGLFAPVESEPDSAAVNMLSHLLSQVEDSRVFQAVSQRKGLAYAVGGDYCPLYNRGFLSVWGRVLASHAQEAIDTVFEEMARLREELVDEELLSDLKWRFQFANAKALDTTSGHIKGMELFIDSNMSPKDFMAQIDAVTPESILEAAQKYLPSSRETGDYVLLLRDPLKTP